MDPLLKENFPRDTKVVAYADDIALLVAGNTRQEIINKTETALNTIVAWATYRGLKFSKEKSVMIPLKGGLVPGFTAEFDEGRIKSVQETRYLGLQLSAGLSFQSHAIKLLESSADVFSRLKSVRKSKWGVSAALSLLIYKAVYIPRISYGSSIWYPSAINLQIQTKMESAQRRVLIAITGAYNTVSTRVLQVIAGTPPIFLHVESLIRVRNGMSKEESEAILAEQWQTLWDGSSKGRWTKEFLPNVRARLHTPITFDHYTTQIISGHGDFNGKLNGFNLVRTPECSCGHPDETAEHIIFGCPIFDDLRQTLQSTIQRQGNEWPCPCSYFAESRQSWEGLEKFARAALIRKEDTRLQERIQLQQDAEQHDQDIQ